MSEQPISRTSEPILDAAMPPLLLRKGRGWNEALLTPPALTVIYMKQDCLVLFCFFFKQEHRKLVWHKWHLRNAERSRGRQETPASSRASGCTCTQLDIPNWHTTCKRLGNQNIQAVRLFQMCWHFFNFILCSTEAVILLMRFWLVETAGMWNVSPGWQWKTAARLSDSRYNYVYSI